MLLEKSTPGTLRHPPKGGTALVGDPRFWVPNGFLLDRWEAIQDELFAALVLRFTGDDTPEKA